MYIYLKDGHIYHKSEQKKLIPNTSLIEVVGFTLADDLIYEDGQVKLYKESEQRKKDHNVVSLEQKIQEVEKKNEELQEVADSEIRRALKL
ncbi:MAG: hypothetical protein LBG52_07530 [Candidatus Peribacteria bacterium]|jgi:hypothetical protein|nr:hypothetical protein [Candidatus Peribacteria bacterium]